MQEVYLLSVCFRSSINDKILELKSLVCNSTPETEKVHKAAVLRNSIDTIRYLQNANSRLEKENRSLKSALSQIKKCHSCGADQPIAVFGTFAANSNADLRELLTDNSPPPTDHSEESSNPSTPSSEVEENRGGRPNASPIALFAIAAGLFLINPGSHHTVVDTEHHVGMYDIKNLCNSISIVVIVI